MENKNLELGVVEDNDNVEMINEEEVIDIENLKEILNEKCTVNADVEELNSLKLNKKKFKEGLEDISLICGQIVGLNSIGVDVKSATDFILQLNINRETIKHNLEISQMTDKQTMI